MKIEDLKNQTVGVLGFGQEGQAVVAYLAKNDIQATIFEAKPSTEWTPEAMALIEKSKSKVVGGEDCLDHLQGFTILFRSPGVWRLHPALLAAEKQGAIITSQVIWFFENSPAQIIGITGTKGKGTTSSLIYEILKADNRSTYLTGNIGKIQPLEILDDLKPDDLIVYELSSFQLQDLKQSPHVGVCLMVTSDHLNHHQDLNEYHIAKSAITAFQNKNDFAIYNLDYPATVKIGLMGEGTKLTISAKEKVAQGANIEGQSILIKNVSSVAETTFDFSNRKLRGDHNLENIAAATLVATSLEIPSETISQTINDFAGLEHRLQFIGTFNGVSYYNDSISTVPEPTIAALNSFTEPIHLIVGGSEKGVDYSALVEKISTQSNIASVTTLGETGKTLYDLLIKRGLRESEKLFGPYQNFDKAIEEIKQRAKAGEVVLLSPASASFDLFKSYADRGEQFEKLVKQ
jgi:UDP-N-acetylmuramoylalanine--D-glutamate ligase